MSSTTASLSNVTSADGAEIAAKSRAGFRVKKVHLWPILLIAMAWFAASVDTIEPFDFWWNVKSGQIMMQTGQFLSTDVLIWSPVREPYSNPQWGSQLLFYWAFALSPYVLLTLRAIIVTVTVGLLIWLCTWRSKSLRIGSIAALIAYMAAWTNYGVRPQMFAFLPFLGFLVLLERKDENPRWLPLIVPIMLFWVNVHGSFFLGVAMLGIYAFGTILEKAGTEEGRKWLFSRAAGWQAIWFVLAAVASVVNPYTTGIYNYFFIATNDPIARSLNAEWQPPTIDSGTGQLFLMQMAIFLASIYISKRRMRATEILVILAFGYLALTSLRNVMWWGWVTAPIMAANFAYWSANRQARIKEQQLAASESTTADEQTLKLTTQSKEIYSINLAMAAILLLGAFAFTPLWRTGNPLVDDADKNALAASTPTKLADFLKTSNVPAPIFNYMEWGGYLEWELYPQYQLFIDGRFEARQVQVWQDYISVTRGRADWQQTLDSYKVRTLVLNKEADAALLPFVAQSSEWKKVYEDKEGIVFTHN